MWASLRYLISNEQSTVYLISVYIKYVKYEEKWRLILDIFWTIAQLACHANHQNVEEVGVF